MRGSAEVPGLGSDPSAQTVAVPGRRVRGAVETHAVKHDVNNSVRLAGAVIAGAAVVVVVARRIREPI